MKGFYEVKDFEVYEVFLFLGFLLCLVWFLFFSSYGVEGEVWVVHFGLFLVSIGSLLWGYGKRDKVKKSFLAKWVFIPVNFISGVCSIVLARALVTQALGLPAEDFESTVMVVSAFCYVPCLIVCSSLLLVFSNLVYLMVCACVGFLKSCVPSGFLRMFPFCGKLYFSSEGVLVSMGFIVVAIFSIWLTGDVLEAYSSQLFVVKKMAYALDYSSISNYPGLGEGVKVNIHGNGVVSFAEELPSGDILIRSEKLQ